MKKYAIIVAGGSGQRMKSAVPKQFLKINNKIILMRSIEAFYNYDPSIDIILALPSDQIDYWNNLCKEHKFNILHKIAEGGHTRFHSVKNALKKVSQKGIVAVHDGVRPLVCRQTIKNVFETAQQKGNAIPYLDSIESVRFTDQEQNKPLDRNKVKLIQTPQAFSSEVLHAAYNQEWSELFTDDASVVEKLGKNIFLVPGNRENIKITNKLDIAISEAILNQESE